MLRLIPGVMILALLLAVIGLKSNRDKWERQAIRSEEARKADRQSYEQAQRDAAANNQADITRIETRQKEITDNAESNYARDLAELRRLRAQGRTDQGAAGKPGVSHLPDATGGPNGTAQVCVSPDDALQSGKTELKLIHLQNWIAELAR